MCSSYRAFGAAGLVTNGAGRDLVQVHRLGFPVFTSSTICSHGYCHLLHFGLPVRIGGLMIDEGDLLHGDENGVTNIPIEIADEVADIAPEFIAAEEIVMNYVKPEGDKSLEEYRKRFAEFQEQVATLTARVRRS
jgi:regulator of RNase E activity RraA